jgi:DNA polymerase elongation subunit (family B)
MKKGLLPMVVEKYLKRRLYFKSLLKGVPEGSREYVWCQQRIDSLKNILVCFYGTTGSLWNRYGNVLVFEEINRLSREILIKTKDIVQKLDYELLYADTYQWAIWISCLGVLVNPVLKIRNRTN